MLYSDFNAPGFNESFKYEYSIPLGHGYMDPVVVSTDAGVFTPLFYPCGGGKPKTQYCVQVLKNGQAFSETINLACNAFVNEMHAHCKDFTSYQVPQLHKYGPRLWMVWC